MPSKTCLIAGALGVAGRAMVEELEDRPDWDVIALSRRAPQFSTRARFLSVDLTDAAACANVLADLDEVTHVYFAAYAPRSNIADEVSPNLAMLVNLVSTLNRVSSGLRHVSLVHGSKWYGNHLGAYKTPAREDDPRHMPPNFYYDQQDWLEAFQKGKRWTWSAWRPHGLCGVSVGSAMNQLTALALYATISRELGLPLRFPGNPVAFRSVYQFTDASVLARAALWAEEAPACANQAFNITNGDYDRWENVWPVIAADFGIAPGPVQTISLARFMADKEPLWAAIRKRHGLREYRLDELTHWGFADWVYSAGFDQMSSLAKVQRAGWHEVLEPAEMFRRLFARLRAERLIP